MKRPEERRRHQRRQVLLPLCVTEKDAGGRLLFRGDTVNIGAGGIYFHTLNPDDVAVSMPVYVKIEVPSGAFKHLPFGGLSGSGEIVRIDDIGESNGASGSSTTRHGVAVRMTSKLRFDPDLHLPEFGVGQS